MKKHILLFACVLAFITSCASAPKTATITDTGKTDTKTQTDQTIDQNTKADTVKPKAPEELLLKARELKKSVFELGLNEIVKDTYDEADTALTKGIEAYDKDNVIAEKELSNSVALFTKVKTEGLVLLSAKKKEAAIKARTDAEKIEANTKAEAVFTIGNVIFAEGEAFEAKENLEAAQAAFGNASLAFGIASKKTLALKDKERIDANDYAKFDAGNYELAEKKLLTVDELALLLLKDSLDAVDEARLRFTLVIQKAFEIAAQTQKVKTDTSKTKSVDIKANIAVAQDFSLAEAAYNEGLAYFADSQFENANASLEKAEALYLIAYENAKIKRDKAEAALKLLETKSQSGESKAKAASGNSTQGGN